MPFKAEPWWMAWEHFHLILKMQVYIQSWRKKKPITHILFSEQYKWERAPQRWCTGMLFKKMQNIRKHSCTQTARRHVVFCTEFRILTVVSMWALRAAGTMTAASQTRCCLCEWQGKAMSIMKNRGPYDERRTQSHLYPWSCKSILAHQPMTW